MLDDALSSSSHLPELVGGRYRIVSRLGVGGMGVVYKAIDIRLKRPVAVKAIEDRRLILPGAVTKLRGEALAAASLDHPYICKVYELVETPTEAYIIMEFVEGETLASIIKRGPLPLLQTLQFGREVAEGLANAHARGLVHRDVKPSNVMVTTNGHVKLLDFGVAIADVESTPGEQTRTLTPQVTVHAGTPLYMAPEQAAGQPVTARADMFSLGVVLYECLTGGLPFSGTTTFDYVRNMMQTAPRRLDRIAPNTPADLVELVERCLEKPPASRPSADAAVAELRTLASALTSPGAAIRTAGHARSGRIWRFVAAGAIVAALAAIGWQTFAPRPSTDAPLRQLRPFVTSAAHEYGSQISPDAQWVAYISASGGGSQVMVQRVDGGEARPLTLGEGAPFSLLWSPDGRQLACVLNVNGASVLQIYPAFFGGAPQQTVTLPDKLRAVRLLRWIDRTIYYQFNVNAPGLLVGRLDVDNPAIQATLNTSWSLEGSLQDVDVSPDGRSVAAVVASADDDGDLWVMNPDGSGARALTNDAFFDRLPVWNGRGDRIIFQSNRGGQVDLWEIDVRTSALTPLTSGEADKLPESSSPDGKLLTFQRLSHDAKLWYWASQDGVGEQLTQDALGDYTPTVAESGRTIAFQRNQPTPSRGYRLFDAKLFVAPFEGRSMGREVRAIGDGFAASLSADGAWLAYLQPSDRAGTYRLLARHLPSGATTVVAPYAATPVLSNRPVDWVSRVMAWTHASDALYFVDQSGPAALRRFRPGQPEADAAIVRLGSPDLYIRDLYPSPGDRMLSYLVVSTSGAEVSTLSLGNGETRVRAKLPRPVLSSVYGRGWLDDAVVLVRAVSLHEDQSADLEILAIGPSGTVNVLGTIEHAIVATTRLHVSRRVLYVTRIEQGIHNLYEFSFPTRTLKALTRNVLPGVTFSGFQPVGDEGLVGSRQERRQDIWLIQESARGRPGNGAGR